MDVDEPPIGQLSACLDADDNFVTDDESCGKEARLWWCFVADDGRSAKEAKLWRRCLVVNVEVLDSFVLYYTACG